MLLMILLVTHSYNTGFWDADVHNIYLTSLLHNETLMIVRP